MDQEGIEVVDIPPYFEKARRNWAKLGIAGKEALLQGPEEGAEGKLYLRMAKVGAGSRKAAIGPCRRMMLPSQRSP